MGATSLGFNTLITEGSVAKIILPQWHSYDEPNLSLGRLLRGMMGWGCPGSGVVTVDITYDVTTTEKGVVNPLRVTGAPTDPYLATDQIFPVGIIQFGNGNSGLCEVRFDILRSMSLTFPAGVVQFTVDYPLNSGDPAISNPDLLFSTFIAPGTRGAIGPTSPVRLTVPIDIDLLGAAPFLVIPKMAVAAVVQTNKASEYPNILFQQLRAPFGLGNISEAPIGTGKDEDSIPIVNGAQAFTLVDTAPLDSNCRVIFYLAL